MSNNIETDIRPVPLSRVEHHADIVKHLLKLQGEARRLRFGGTVGDAHIEKYIEGIKVTDKIYGIFDAELELIAFCHVAIFDEDGVKSGEVGISVDSDYRNKHIGTVLFKSVIRNLRAKGVKVLYSYCLSENQAMKKLAMNEKMCLVLEHGDYEAKIQLQDPSVYGVMVEPMLEHIALVDHNFKKRTLFMQRIHALMMVPLTYGLGVKE